MDFARSRRSSIEILIWAVICCASACGAGTAAAAAASPGSGVAPVAVGVGAAGLPGATVFGDTPPDTPESVSFVLREQNQAGLQTAVANGVHHYLSVTQFAGTYGQTPAHVAALQAYLAKFHITTQVYPGNVDVAATGTAGEFDQALAIDQRQYRIPQRSRGANLRPIPAQIVHGTDRAPELPTSIAPYVTAILGLSNYAPFGSQAVHVPSATRPATSSSPNSCLELTGFPSGCHTPADFGENYRLTPLYQRGATGQGRTLAIVTLAAMDPGAPEYFWKHVLGLPPSHRTLSVVKVDGGAGRPSFGDFSDETDLDVEQAGAIAPDANLTVYETPNGDRPLADAFFAAASQNVAGSVSVSFGDSETDLASAFASGTETPAFGQALDEVFLEMAIQGQSTFASSADFGAYTAVGDLGTTNLSVDVPASSPYISAAGGTTLPWTGAFTGASGTSAPVSVSAQRIWGWDYTWTAIATSSGEPLSTVARANSLGSGGGFSTTEPQPAYQAGLPGTSAFGAVPYLIPENYQHIGGLIEPTAWGFNPTPDVIHGSGSGRALPDLSADADPYSGYLVYCPSCVAAGYPSPLIGTYGGTSFVAPQLNAATAVIDSYLGRRVGFWNPQIYSFAQGSTSPFTPLDRSGTENDNNYYTGTPGLAYNEGGGLGYPDLFKLAQDFRAEP